jgi:Tfp pilus assembly protein PilF
MRNALGCNESPYCLPRMGHGRYNHPAVMRAKYNQRQRPVRQQGRNPPCGKNDRRRLGWGAMLLVGLAGLTVAGWCLVSFWKHSTKESLQSPMSVPPLGTEASTRAPSAQRPPHAGNYDPTFIEQVNHGNELLAQSKPAEAVEVLTKAMRMNPDDEDVHYNLGLALTRLGKFEEAVKQYEEALRIFPDYVEAHSNLGNLLMRTGRTEEAIPHFELAVKIMPDYSSGHNNLGTALQKSGRVSEALPHFREAVKLNPKYWEAHFNVGTSCLQQSKLSEARGEFETVLRLRPEFEPARLALAEIEAQESAGAPLRQ